jgi:hypothetical protein
MSLHAPTILLPPAALDPTLVSVILSDLAIPVDPKLLAIESLVRQCNCQIPISLELLPEALEPEPVPPPATIQPASQLQPPQEEEEHMVVDMEEEGIDPALREIVDHLAREQVRLLSSRTSYGLHFGRSRNTLSLLCISDNKLCNSSRRINKIETVTLFNNPYKQH